ncbi:pilus assembly protein N-terminal domain-containing protein [Marinobacterium rhizophilum]|uniref:Pilus assembly protein N-terminal domain-containing protein n=1 Tax=Marinobacterium rhizophilum TaxID=420402 RepID=A0ABY5HI34_9GAMM|nr:pilus assembly protein N-terminal domain-containing protein [Marinobacterium rhizophilum]UTW12046.1 pilus assembly protein N-terminal domain-containing protein [Marinobacterium rhizophilum]
MLNIIRNLAIVIPVLGWAFSSALYADQGLLAVETANGRQSSTTRELVQWTHARLIFNKDLERVAVGQDKTLEVEILGGNELLALAKQVGRTSLIVWYVDNTSETFLFSVSEDLSVLRRALRDIHPNIVIQTAPDRPALVLRGQVPTVKYRVAAEAVARNYLNAGQQGGAASADAMLLRSVAGTASMPTPVDNHLRVGNPVASNTLSSAVINLIQVDELPRSTTKKIQDAIKSLGGGDVRVRRMVRGDVEDDRYDTLVLEGEVRDQVSLTRILNVASRLFVGFDAAIDPANAVAAIADESGALLNGRSKQGLSGGNFGGASSTGALTNDIDANIARSKLLSVSGGRILSMISVRDVPLVRVSVQMHEINRSRMKSWRPDMSLVTNGYSSDGLFGLGGQSSRGAGSSTVENALQILGGTLTNNLQIGTTDLAFDLLFSLMEDEGISRTLSRPTMTVLAGEPAVFQVGGEVPVPTAFAPAGLSGDDEVGTNTSGVFSGTEFKPFGVQLKVRAMVDENDRITLDLAPTISTPDTQLTRQIAGSTGSDLNTSAFNVRSLETSTRLRDGQPLVLGGLVSRDLSSQENYTPGLHNMPVIGWFAESSGKSDVDSELVIIVTPTIVREPMNDTALWQFPAPLTLLDWAVGTVVSTAQQEAEAAPGLVADQPKGVQ